MGWRKKAVKWVGTLVGVVLLWFILMGYFQAVVDWFLDNAFWGLILLLVLVFGYAFIAGKFRKWFGR